MRGQDKDVREQRERSVVARDTGEPALCAVIGVEAERQRVSYAAFEDVTRYPSRPVRLAEERVEHVEVESRGVGGDEMPTADPFVVAT